MGHKVVIVREVRAKKHQKNMVLAPKIALILGALACCFIVTGAAVHVSALVRVGQICAAAGIVYFFLYAIWLLLQPESRTPDAGLVPYARAFFADWMSGMSGPLTVPFAALAIWSAQGKQKIIWGCLAVAAGLLGSYRVWQRERVANQATVAQLQRQIDQFKTTIERLTAKDGTEKVWAELVGEDGKEYKVQLRLHVRDVRVNERAMPVGRFIEGFDLWPNSATVVENGNYSISFEFDAQHHKERATVRGGKMFAV